MTVFVWPRDHRVTVSLGQVHFSPEDWYDLMHSIGRPVLESLSLPQFDEIMVEQVRFQ